MKLRFTISLLLFTVFMVFSGTLHAQLLEDTDRKLKTTKTKRKFSLFKKRQKKASPPFLSFGRTNKGKTITPTSSGIPFSGRVANIQPRSASGSPFSNARPVAAPRLSVGSPFKGKYKVKPRFSVGLPFTGKDRLGAPQFSGPKPFTRRDNPVPARFSAGLPFTRKDYPGAPRFSGPKPFTRKDYPKRPQFSGPKPFTRKDFPVSPRFSEGLPFTRKDYPDYPRNSPGSPFVGVKWKVKPRFSGRMTFNLWTQRVLESIFPNRYVSSFTSSIKFYRRPDLSAKSIQLSRYLGPYKFKPKKAGRNTHPSYRYKKSVLVANDTVREGLRRWNIFWTGFNRNSEASKGVRKKISKPKFDRKEREIWNN